MQNVFLDVYHAAQFDPLRGSAKVWILQYAYHRSMNRRQQLMTRQFYSTSDIAEIEDKYTPQGNTSLASHESRHLVKQALATLNSTQKQVLELAYFEGLSLREIAEQTGESLGNVRHQYYRITAGFESCESS